MILTVRLSGRRDLQRFSAALTLVLFGVFAGLAAPVEAQSKDLTELEIGGLMLGISKAEAAKRVPDLKINGVSAFRPGEGDGAGLKADFSGKNSDQGRIFRIILKETYAREIFDRKVMASLYTDLYGPPTEVIDLAPAAQVTLMLWGDTSLKELSEKKAEEQGTYLLITLQDSADAGAPAAGASLDAAAGPPVVEFTLFDGRLLRGGS